MAIPICKSSHAEQQNGTSHFSVRMFTMEFISELDGCQKNWQQFVLEATA